MALATMIQEKPSISPNEVSPDGSEGRKLNDHVEDKDFLFALSSLEDECERHTLERLPHLGEKAPKCRETLGACLSILSQIASCSWGCLHDDHVLEYIVGRSTTIARGSLRLLQKGLYDESLALNRNFGEVANLLTYFAQHPSSLEAWKTADERTRKSKYSPVKIRMVLEQTRIPIVVDEGRYGF